MKIEKYDIVGPALIIPNKFGDSRGFFSEVFVESRFKEIDPEIKFVQDNQSFSAKKGTIRGLHFQKPPYAQAKLVRCLRGSIFDVAVDIRDGSPTYGKWVGAVLSHSNWSQLYVPIGFAHGFVTLEDDTEVMYKVSDYYNKESEGGIIFDDPNLAIDWGINRNDAVLSDKDLILPELKDLGVLFP